MPDRCEIWRGMVDLRSLCRTEFHSSINGQIWLARVNLWCALLWQFSAQSVHRVSLRGQKPQIFTVFSDLTFCSSAVYWCRQKKLKARTQRYEPSAIQHHHFFLKFSQLSSKRDGEAHKHKNTHIFHLRRRAYSAQYEPYIILSAVWYRRSFTSINFFGSYFFGCY